MAAAGRWAWAAGARDTRQRWPPDPGSDRPSCGCLWLAALFLGALLQSIARAVWVPRRIRALTRLRSRLRGGGCPDRRGEQLSSPTSAAAEKARRRANRAVKCPVLLLLFVQGATGNSPPPSPPPPSPSPPPPSPPPPSPSPPPSLLPPSPSPPGPPCLDAFLEFRCHMRCHRQHGWDCKQGCEKTGTIIRTINQCKDECSDGLSTCKSSCIACN